MSPVKSIREAMRLTQVELAAAIGVSQGSVSMYENGVVIIPPDVADRLIQEARKRGHVVSFDDVYKAIAVKAPA